MNRDLYKAAVDDIKVDEELIDDLIIKIKENKRKSRFHSRYGVIAASVLIVAFGIVIMQLRQGLFSEKKIVKLDPGSTISTSHGKIKINVNKIEGIRSSKILIPEGAYSKNFKLENISEPFGRNPLPEVPKEFKVESDSIDITYDPSGKMLFMSTLVYSKDINNPSSPTIEMKFNQNELPPRDCIYSSAYLNLSDFGNTKVTIGSATLTNRGNEEGKAATAYVVYSAQFIYKGIGYDITAKRIDADTFINLLKSIIK